MKPSEYSTLWRVMPTPSQHSCARAIRALMLIEKPRASFCNSVTNSSHARVLSENAATVVGVFLPSISILKTPSLLLGPCAVGFRFLEGRYAPPWYASPRLTGLYFVAVRKKRFSLGTESLSLYPRQGIAKTMKSLLRFRSLP